MKLGSVLMLVKMKRITSNGYPLEEKRQIHMLTKSMSSANSWKT
jgi:hypothetical protein